MVLIELIVTFRSQQYRGCDPLPAEEFPSFGFHPSLPNDWCVVPALEWDAMVSKCPPGLFNPVVS